MKMRLEKVSRLRLIDKKLWKDLIIKIIVLKSNGRVVRILMCLKKKLNNSTISSLFYSHIQSD